MSHTLVYLNLNLKFLIKGNLDLNNRNFQRLAYIIYSLKIGIKYFKVQNLYQWVKPVFISLEFMIKFIIPSSKIIINK